MGDLVELIFALIVIIAAVLGKLKEGAGDSSSTSDSDLAALEDFFRKHSKKTPTSSADDSRVTQSRKRKEKKKVEIQTPQQDIRVGDEGVSLERQPSYEGHSLEGTSLEGDSLEGASFESPSITSFQSLESTETLERASPTIISREMQKTAAVLKPRRKFRFSKNDLINGFIISEVLSRYDINRIFSRIPGRRD